MADPLGVSVAFSADWNIPDPAWTRLDTLSGCRVRGWQIDRGRPDEFSKTDVGTARVTIVDRAGLFDPTNSSSPYAGNVLPGRQAAIALHNPVNDTWHTLFRGFVETWSYQLDRTRQYMELELGLVDGFAILSRAELQVGVDGAIPPFTGYPPARVTELNQLAAGNVLYGRTEGPVSDRMHAILGDVNWPPELALPHTDPTRKDIFSGNVRVGPKAYGPGTSALDALQDAADAEFPGVANLYMSADGHVTFHGRQARFRPDVTEYAIQQWTVGDPSTAGTHVPLAELEWTLGLEAVYNSVTATPQGIGLAADPFWRPLNPGTPGALEPGEDDVTTQLVEDATSVGKYGRRALTFDQLQTVEEVATGANSMVATRKHASYYVTNYKAAQPRISRLVVKTRRPGDANAAELWKLFCNCEISDLLTVHTAHPGGGGFTGIPDPISNQFYVEGIHYTARPGPPEHPIVELSLDVSPRAHWTTSPYPGGDTP